MSSVTPYNTNNISLFQPNQISGLALWLDAADSNTVLRTGINVTRWNDKSGNKYDATAFGTGSPTYSSNSIVFNGAQAFSTTLSSLLPNQSGFAIVKYSSTSKIDIISLRELTGTAGGIQQIIQNNVPLITTYGGTTIVTGGTLTQNTILLYNYTFGATTNAFIYTNGSQTATTTGPYSLTGTGTVNIGGYDAGPGEGFIGSMYEVILFNVVLTTQQRQQIESYLAYKWNLQSSLPTTHPYYNSPYNAYPPFTNINQTVKFAYPVLPSDIGGLALWLDAADGSSVITSGSNVTRWNDKSGNGFNMSNNASYQSPTYSMTGFNGRPTISFFRNSSSSFTILENRAFSFTSNSVTLFFITQRNGSATTYQRFFSGASNINGTDYNSGVFNINSFGGLSLERGAYLTSAFTTTNPFLGELIINGTGSNIGNFNTVTNYIYTNGNQLTSGTTPTAGSNINIVHVRLGAGTQTPAGNDYGFEALQGNTSEVLMFNRVLTTTELQQIEGYLTYKWGLQGRLPVNHPYYNNPITQTIVQSIPSAITMYQYSPRSLSGLALWLDAADSATVPLSPGTQNVTGWNDKSGNLRDGTATGTISYRQKAINSLSALSFTGISNSYIRGSITITGTTFTAFAIAALDNITCKNDARILSLGAVGVNDYSSTNYSAAIVRQFTSQTLYTYRNNNGITPVSINYNVPFLVCVIYDGVNKTLIINSTSSNSNASTGNFNISNYQIGASFTEEATLNYGGFIGEEIIYSSVLTLIQRQQIEGYLAWKWGLQANLPANHPYKLYPPS